VGRMTRRPTRRHCSPKPSVMVWYPPPQGDGRWKETRDCLGRGAGGEWIGIDASRRITGPCIGGLWILFAVDNVLGEAKV
jgi:hypothetical protein